MAGSCMFGLPFSNVVHVAAAGVIGVGRLGVVGGHDGVASAKFVCGLDCGGGRADERGRIPLRRACAGGDSAGVLPVCGVVRMVPIRA